MNLIRNYIYNALYQIFALFTPLLTMPYIARILGPASLGIHSFTAANTQYFILICSIGMTYGCQQIAITNQNKTLRSQIFWELFILRLLILGLTLFTFLIFINCTQRHYLLYYLAQSIQIIAVALDISWLYQGMENFKLITIRNFMIRIISTLSILIFINDSADLLLYITILSVTTLLGNLTIYATLHYEITKPNLHHLDIVRHIKPALLLLLPEIMIVFYVTINKTSLGLFGNMTAVAYFENADRLIKILITIVTASGIILIPRINALYANNHSEQIKKLIIKSFSITSFLSFPMIAGIYALSEDFSLWFFSDKFIGINHYINVEAILIILVGWSNVIGVQFLIPTQKIKFYLYSVSLGAVTNLILNYPAILIFHDIGVVYATICAEIVVTMYQFYVAKKYLNITHMLLDSLIFLFAAMSMFLLLSYMTAHLPFSLYHFVMEIFVGFVFYLLVVSILYHQKIKQLISH